MGSFWSFLVSYPEVYLSISCFLCITLLRLIRRCQKSAIPVNWPVVGMLPFFLRNLYHIHDKVADFLHEAGWNSMVFGPGFLNMNFFVTCDPATANHCLNANFKKYPKGNDFAEMLDFLGGAILVSDFESWEYQRHMVMVNLGSRAFRSFAMSTITRKAGTTLLPYLDDMAKLGSEVELEGVFMRFFLDVTYTSAFATDLDCLSMSRPIHAFGQATKEVEEGVLFRHMMPPSLWKFLRVLNVGSEKKMANARVVIDRFIYEEIAKRKTKRNKESQGDVLSLLMKWPMDPSMSKQQMTLFRRDTVMAFIFATKDLVAVTLMWFFYMMCKHPHVEARILEEVKALQSTTLPGNLSVFEGDMLQRAIYLQAALLETLRLFPAAPFEEVEACADDVLPNGARISKGTRIVFSIYAMGRAEGI
ncbi:hypothetical protein ACQ4PT_026659 [Festuca glaucescens]